MHARLPDGQQRALCLELWCWTHLSLLCRPLKTSMEQVVTFARSLARSPLDDELSAGAATQAVALLRFRNLVLLYPGLLFFQGSCVFPAKECPGVHCCLPVGCMLETCQLHFSVVPAQGISL